MSRKQPPDLPLVSRLVLDKIRARVIDPEATREDIADAVLDADYILERTIAGWEFEALYREGWAREDLH